MASRDLERPCAAAKASTSWGFTSVKNVAMWTGHSASSALTAIGRRVVVVRAFVKKTQKTPRAEIELALRRAKEIT